MPARKEISIKLGFTPKVPRQYLRIIDSRAFNLLLTPKIMSGYDKVIKSQYVPLNPKKYLGDPTQIICRSSWERRFCKWCDSRDNVLRWASEEIVVPYQSPIDHKLHRYFIDFYVEMLDKHGKVKKLLIEIKPFIQTQPPIQKKRKTSTFLNEVMTFSVNTAKWKAATEFATKHGLSFVILTEKQLGIVS